MPTARDRTDASATGDSMNDDIYVWPDSSWIYACDYCWETYRWKSDDFQIISGDEYVITPEGDVILKETGDLL